jgi:hypothetical protein
VGRLMSDQEPDYRKAAAECLEQARTASTPGIRGTLLALAERWLERARHSESNQGDDKDLGRASYDTDLD